MPDHIFTVDIVDGTALEVRRVALFMTHHVVHRSISSGAGLLLLLAVYLLWCFVFVLN